MNLQKRVTNILTKPEQEWPVIAGELVDATVLTQEYIVPLAAIPAVASFVGMWLVGISAPFVGTIRYGLVHSLVNAVVQYVLTIVGVHVGAIVVDKLAPNFESRSNPIQALKLVAYSSTAVWLAGVFNLVPALFVVGVLAAVYSIYLVYLGLPVLMKTPRDKVVPYMAVSAVVVIVIMVVMGLITSTITGILF